MTVHTLTAAAAPAEPPDLLDFRAVLGLRGLLALEQRQQDRGELDPADRVTCPQHSTWIHRCAHSDAHVTRSLGVRWCSPCGTALDVVVDELTRAISLRCNRCGTGARSRADHRLVEACHRSLGLAQAAAQIARPR